LRGVDIHRELEQMLGSEARFRGLQEPVLQAIIKHQSPIVTIMGTGVGKSLMFQLLARCTSSGTTIVISPLVSLQDHMVERCQQAGISCVKWDARNCHSTSQIVIVTSESAVGCVLGSHGLGSHLVVPPTGNPPIGLGNRPQPNWDEGPTQLGPQNPVNKAIST
jgi:hypothetical protein